MNTPSEESTPYLFPIEENGGITIREFNPETESIWPELVEVFQKHDIKKPIFLSQPEYQLETLFYLACKKCCLPPIIGTVYNLPLTIEIIEKIKPDILISTPYLANILIKKLEGCTFKLPFSTIFLFSKATQDITSFEKLVPNIDMSINQYPL